MDDFMTVSDILTKLPATCVTGSEMQDRQVDGIFCCDLLSLVMGRAKANDAWLTVMGNINAVAVAVLSDVACIIVCEGMDVDESAILKAKAQDVIILKTELPIFEASIAVDSARTR